MVIPPCPPAGRAGGPLMGDQKPVIHFLVGRYCAEMVGGGGGQRAQHVDLKAAGREIFLFPSSWLRHLIRRRLFRKNPLSASQHIKVAAPKRDQTTFV
jgi:hypothetical protein